MSNLPLLPISVCIVTNTISDTLLRSIMAVQSFASEICVGLDGAETEISDELRSMERVQCNIIDWDGYSGTKNKLASKARYDWILSLDSDEVMDEVFCDHIRNFDFSNHNLVGQIRRRYFLGSKLIRFGNWGRNKVVRLYHRNHARWNKDAVHEGIETKSGSALQIIRMQGHMLHYTAKSIDEVAAKNDVYADLVAQKYFEQGKSALHLHTWAAPVLNFVVGYLIHGGILDGSAGLQLALESARYTRRKYISLYQLAHRTNAKKEAISKG